MKLEPDPYFPLIQHVAPGWEADVELVLDLDEERLPFVLHVRESSVMLTPRQLKYMRKQFKVALRMHKRLTKGKS